MLLAGSSSPAKPRLYTPGGTIDDLVKNQVLHPACGKIFRLEKSETDHTGRQLLLHAHQRDAIVKSKENKSYILTSGTGSGKSLTYIVPILHNHVLRNGSSRGIQTIVVYPMNALANSQAEELKKFLEKGYPEGKPPVRSACYAGKRKVPQEAIGRDAPDILLTNYLMLEFLLTRTEDRELVRAAQALRFLVFDELHTYRGRQGADVALLIRRCRQAFGGHGISVIGTSATSASVGTTAEQKLEVAKVTETFFAAKFEPDQVIGETLERATAEVDCADQKVIGSLRDTITKDTELRRAAMIYFHLHPLASWIESIFGVRAEHRTNRLVRQPPRRLQAESGATEELARLRRTEFRQDTGQALFAALSRRVPSCAAVSLAVSLFSPFDCISSSHAATLFGLRSNLKPYATLRCQRWLPRPGEPEKPLYPLVFCRHCGAAYYRVKVVTEESKKLLLAREDRREEHDDGTGEAYVCLFPKPHHGRG